VRDECARFSRVGHAVGVGSYDATVDGIRKRVFRNQRPRAYNPGYS
jgi:hypothetical protein